MFWTCETQGAQHMVLLENTKIFYWVCTLFLNKKFKDFSRTFKDTFPIFKDSIQCKKDSWDCIFFSSSKTWAILSWMSFLC